MKRVLMTERLPIFLWLDEIEEGAEKQAQNLANLPFAFKHIAIMPDSHLGYGMPIGGVLATEGVIIPNAVGVDIGCGMAVGRLKIGIQLADSIIKDIFHNLRKDIPVGFEHRKEPWMDDKLPDVGLKPIISGQEAFSLHKQLGTLGGGNHFIEFQRDQFGYWWVMVHSGSRNIGKKVAEYYNKIAKTMNERWHSVVPANQDLAFLPIESDEAHWYKKEMEWCIEFARLNRKVMLDIIEFNIGAYLGLKFIERYDVAHNYARFENHYGKNVIVHRKGATAARLNEIVIIPGSQGTKSYIGYGKGNRQSFNSCSHGAGRKMSRSKARKELILEEEIKKMDEQGIIHGIRNQSDLDESMSAYKDIDEVMRNQEDLVSVKWELTPKAVIKG